MATYKLLNTVTTKAKKYFAGDDINDALVSTTEITDAGGVLVVAGNAKIDAAAAKCKSLRKSKGVNEDACDAIMFAAWMDAGAAALAAATASAAGFMAAADKKYLDSEHAAAGADLADADSNFDITQGAWRKLPTLGAARTYTLQTTGAIAGDQVTVTRTSTAAFTAAFVNGGAGAGTMHTLPASKIGSVKFQFDGTNWALREVGVGT